MNELLKTLNIEEIFLWYWRKLDWRTLEVI
jgi:hypothetical protein